MASINDRWTIPNPVPGAKPARVRGPRYGVGLQWIAEYAYAGRKYRKSFQYKGAAEAWLVAQEHSKAQGAHVAPNKTTVGDLWPVHAAIKARAGRKTREGYEQAWRLHVAPRWADVPVVDVTKVSVQQWLPELTTTRTGKPASASLLHKVVLTLSQLLDLAVADRKLGANPLADMTGAISKAEPRARRYLSVDEVDALLAACRDEQIELPVKVLIRTGIRRGEMAGLMVGNLDAGRKRLRVERDIDDHGDPGATKAKRHRDVPVAGALLAELVLVAGGRDRLAPLLPSPLGKYEHTTGQPWVNGWWRSRWERATVTAGLEGFTTHELRHTAASLAIHAGADVKTVQRMLGHASAAMTLDLYGHLWDEQLDAVAERVDAHLTAERGRRR